jgi:F-type H+-transporting ATPase subunit epsilon
LLKLDLVSPEGLIYEDKEVESVHLCTIEGEIDILEGHMDLLTVLKEGVLIAGNAKFMVEKSGIAEVVNGDTVVITAEFIKKLEN